MGAGLRAPARGREKPPTTPDPIEIAMEAEAAGEAPAGVAARLLEDQRRLIRWQIAGERAGFALKVLTGAAGVVVAGVLAAMVWQASRADGLIVEAFSVPPELAATGATGEVVARTVLDRLGELDRGANSLESVRLTDAWTQDVKVVVPTTGVSLGEVQRALRQWLGHETHMTGEVVRTAAGMRLTARTGIGRIVTAEGSAEALPQLARQVADGLFADARPIQYGEYLFRARRDAEAYPRLVAAASATEDPVERAWAENLLGLIDQRSGRPEQAYARFLRAAKAPDRLVSGLSLSAAAGALEALGRNYEAVGLRDRAIRRLSGVRGRIADWYRIGLRANVASDRWDLQEAMRLLAPMVGRANAGTSGTYRNTYAYLLARAHEPSAARRLRQSVDPTIDFYAEDWPQFLAIARAQHARGDSSPRILAAEAFGLARLGQPAEALKVLQGTPEDCYFCVGARALALSQLGDAAGAERAFAQIERLDPTNIFGVVLWGRERLRRGDAKGALETFRRAEKAAPRYADGIAWQGEALMAMGDARGAVEQFAKAEPFAPRWGRLHLKWGEALAKLGQAEAAQAQWRAAASMDLTAEERAELARVMR